MCGIVGMICYAGGITPHEAKMFSELLYIGALRGTHGTGAFAIANDGSRYQIKVGGPPTQLFEDPSYKAFSKFVEKKETQIMIGHNRYATTGEKTTANSHPFREGKTTLVHNGTIETWGKFKKESKEFPVDSQAVTYLIDKYGIEEVVATISGAWAIVAWNDATKQLNIFKNIERPLHVCHRPASKLYWMASEAEMLEWMMKRNYMNEEKVVSIENNRLYTFDLGADKPVTKVLETSKERSFRLYTETFGEPSHNAGAAFVKTDSSSAANQEILSPKERPVPVRQAPYPIVLPNMGLGSGQKTGKVRVPSPASALRESWVRVQHLKDLSEGMPMVLEIADVNPIKDTTEGFQFILMHEKYPDIRFLCNVSGKKTADELLGADSVKAFIHNIQKSNNNPALSSHRIMLQHAVPIYNNIILPSEGEILDEESKDLSGTGVV